MFWCGLPYGKQHNNGDTKYFIISVTDEAEVPIVLIVFNILYIVSGIYSVIPGFWTFL